MGNYRRPVPQPGERYSRWTVIDQVGWRGTHRLFLCRCDCGNEGRVLACNLRWGNSLSCGCTRREATIKRNTTHGAIAGGVKERTYFIWERMRVRCGNPNDKTYRLYGARGITICAGWSTYPPFRDWALANGYAEGLYIDRIDSDKGYWCGSCWECVMECRTCNCRWVTPKQNANNARTNVRLTAFGEEKTMAEWADDLRCVVSYTALQHRVRERGWEVERALTTPARITKASRRTA